MRAKIGIVIVVLVILAGAGAFLKPRVEAEMIAQADALRAALPPSEIILTWQDITADALSGEIALTGVRAISPVPDGGETHMVIDRATVTGLYPWRLSMRDLPLLELKGISVTGPISSELFLSGTLEDVILTDVTVAVAAAGSSFPYSGLTVREADLQITEGAGPSPEAPGMSVTLERLHLKDARDGLWKTELKDLAVKLHDEDGISGVSLARFDADARLEVIDALLELYVYAEDDEPVSNEDARQRLSEVGAYDAHIIPRLSLQGGVVEISSQKVMSFDWIDWDVPGDIVLPAEGTFVLEDMVLQLEELDPDLVKMLGRQAVVVDFTAASEAPEAGAMHHTGRLDLGGLGSLAFEMRFADVPTVSFEEYGKAFVAGRHDEWDALVSRLNLAAAKITVTDDGLLSALRWGMDWSDQDIDRNAKFMALMIGGLGMQLGVPEEEAEKWMERTVAFVVMGGSLTVTSDPVQPVPMGDILAAAEFQDLGNLALALAHTMPPD